MQRNPSVTLGKHFEEFVEVQIGTGVYCTRSEVVRAGLTLLEQHQLKVKALRSVIEAGINSDLVECSYDHFMSEMRRNDGADL